MLEDIKIYEIRKGLEIERAPEAIRTEIIAQTFTGVLNDYIYTLCAYTLRYYVHAMYNNIILLCIYTYNNNIRIRNVYTRSDNNRATISIDRSYLVKR